MHSSDRPTTLEDYDEEFIYLLKNINPVYRINAFLDYHYEGFLDSGYPDKNLFITHIRYVILPTIERTALKEFSEIIRVWIEKTEKSMLAIQIQQKNELLARAYAAACDAYPSSPYLHELSPWPLLKTWD